MRALEGAPQPRTQRVFPLPVLPPGAPSAVSHQRPPKGAIAVRQSHLEKRALDGHARLL